MKKVIISLLIILLIAILVCLGIIYFYPSNSTLRYVYNVENEGKIEKMPINVADAIGVYDGEIEQRTIYKALYMLVTEIIPDYYDNIEEIQKVGVENYFNSNKNKISSELGIAESKDFSSFIETIENLRGKLELEEYTFNPYTVNKRREHLDNVLIIKYENNDKIGLNIRISDVLNEKVFPVTCFGGVEEVDLKYEYEVPDTTVPDTLQFTGRVV